MPCKMKITSRKERTGNLLALGILVISLAAVPLDAEESVVGGRETIVFGGSIYYPPFQWRDRTGEARGFVIDLQEAIAAQGGKKAEHHLMNWEDALRSVESGESDVIALFASEARSENFDFTEPFYHVAHGIFSHVDDEGFAHLDALVGHPVAVVAGSYAEQLLAARDDGIRLIAAPNELTCLELVANRKAVACVEAAHTSRHLAANANLKVHQTSPPFWPRPYVFGVRKGETELLEWFTRQLAMIQLNGTYQEVYTAWLPELEWQERTLLDTLRTLSWLIIPVLVLASAGYLWSWSLRKQVARKTHRLATELKARKSLEEQLQYRAEHDMLTALPNRTAFLDRLEKLIVADPNGKPIVIAIRIANLEQLITTFSYGIAYELVRAFAQRLAALDFQLVAHFGEGLFAALPKHHMNHEEIVSLVTKTLEIIAIDLEPQIVMGMATDTQTGSNTGVAEELIRRAVTALSAAQKKGRGWLDYSANLEPDPVNLRLLKDFHRYGTRDMFLEYQPKADLRSGHIDAAEALIRWQHPSLGLVSPTRFIPLVEQSGLITQITRWVLEEAVRMIIRHRLSDSNHSISVNLAPRDLLETDFVNFIIQATEPIKSHCLRLEITETGLIEDSVRARQVLSELRDAGIFCAVDDFGTGNSSLSYLSKFPLDEIKLDRSYVFDMLENQRHRIIVRSTIALAHELGLTVTAEGAEDIQTIHALREMGCDAVQGYAISRPVSEEQLLSILGQEIESVIG